MAVYICPFPGDWGKEEQCPDRDHGCTVDCVRAGMPLINTAPVRVEKRSRTRPFPGKGAPDRTWNPVRRVYRMWAADGYSPGEAVAFTIVTLTGITAGLTLGALTIWALWTIHPLAALAVTTLASWLAWTLYTETRR